ncbi:hypothetical protein [Picosynechococcus sp. PCC 7003]|uniref:glycosyl-4,4'-diaponeurosporenoate acyltransferase CrtO family protein n=1 Tax=Picosynechococcus sp. PCC 7003 TaxID=374981 RepID=UPI0009038604|nr:hypothetical protein [Picosynechococcus sp. PCC 7003]
MESLIALPIFRPSASIIIGLCVGGWTTWSFVVGYLCHRLPLHFLENDTCLTLPYFFGETRSCYEHHLGIKRWKDRLPEAGNFFPGGFRKDAIDGKNSAVLSRFLAETRRAEYVHLGIWAFWIVTMLWTPGWGIVINFSFGTILNLPCIWVQRYNRLRLQDILRQQSNC